MSELQNTNLLLAKNKQNQPQKPSLLCGKLSKEQAFALSAKAGIRGAPGVNTKRLVMIKVPNQFETEKHATEECINSQGLQAAWCSVIWVFLYKIKLGNSFWKALSPGRVAGPENTDISCFKSFCIFLPILQCVQITIPIYTHSSMVLLASKSKTKLRRGNNSTYCISISDQLTIIWNKSRQEPSKKMSFSLQNAIQTRGILKNIIQIPTVNCISWEKEREQRFLFLVDWENSRTTKRLEAYV